MNKYINELTERERKRQTDRQTDRQTETERRRRRVSEQSVDNRESPLYYKRRRWRGRHMLTSAALLYA